MSVQSATTRNDYTAGASQTVYAYTFEIKAASDITVIVGGVTKSLNTDYTVSGVGTNSGGNVTLSAAPASGTTVSLVMEMDLARDTDYQASGAFLADDVNNDFDSLWLATNQQETELGRSLRLNQTEPTSDMTLPLKDARKGSVLAFNETTGLPVAGPTIANVDSVAGITGDIATVADNDANITTVAGISGDVTSVANISANVTTVAGNTTNINAVAADASDIGTVASNISNVNTTAGISSDVTTVAGNNVNITTVAGDSSEITTVAGVASDVSIVSGIASDVTAVAGDASDIGTVASSISNVNAVGTNITNVNNVAGNASNINTVAADGTDIGTVAGISANVTTVAGISSDVTTVAGLETKMDTVIADASDIGTVAGISANVTTVANNSSNVTTVAGLETKMDTIIADAADIGAVATNINSVTTVSGISGDVTTVASKASDVETVADNIGDVQAASQNATNAAASAQAAASSASTAGTHATNASASANQAANSATGADDSEAAAGISASAASSSASAASSSASSAASSASDANDSQAAAALSASGASVSASAAAVSAGNSETAAATWNNFYTTYLGAAASAPSTDLLGQPLQDGALYFNTTDDTMYVFNGSIWIAAESTINIVSVPTQLAADLTTNGNDIIFGDNDKATFGAGDDLEIYHDGSNSYIIEQGTGNLRIAANDFELKSWSTNETYMSAHTNGEVSLRFNNLQKLATTATGIDVTGSVVADGLSVTNTATTGTNQEVASFRTASGGGLVIRSSDLSAANPDSILEPFFGESLKVKTSGNDRFKVAGNGDISFYEDTGTTPKFFWDASAESLGIGTSSPTRALEVYHATAAHLNIKTGTLGISYLNFGDTDDDNVGRIEYAHSGNSMQFFTAATEAMRIDSSGRVGIGTSSPHFELSVHESSANADARIHLTNADTGTGTGDGFQIIMNGANAGRQVNLLNREASPMAFWTNNAERMRIDASGNLLVGKTSAVYNTAGTQLASDGQVFITGGNQYGLAVNRTTGDGDLVLFSKDGTTVGSIGVDYGDRLYIGTGNTGLFFNNTSSAIQPIDTGSNLRDDAVDLGSSGTRFKDIYATNGTIQTSDRNEKQDIAELSDAEQRVAVAAKGLLRKFRWKDSVAEKGDDARIHFGIIAQDLQAAFEAEGLDAGDYAMFISTTWTDEETNEEKTRMGVRYSELLAFIIAAI